MTLWGTYGHTLCTHARTRIYHWGMGRDVVNMRSNGSQTISWDIWGFILVLPESAVGRVRTRLTAYSRTQPQVLECRPHPSASFVRPAAPNRKIFFHYKSLFGRQIFIFFWPSKEGFLVNLFFFQKHPKCRFWVIFEIQTHF